MDLGVLAGWNSDFYQCLHTDHLQDRAISAILKKPAGRIDRVIAILVFDGFSILGTYVGIPLTSGPIGNVRDLGP